MKPTTQQRLSPMDCMKGLAIIMVVLGHNFNFGIQETNGVALFRILSIIQLPIFVFVSGYFTTKPVITPWQTKEFVVYWRNKVIRLLLPLFITPFLFRVFCSGGVLDRPTYEILLGEYWFTLTLFILFCIFDFVRMFVAYLMNIIKPNNLVLVESVCFIISFLAIDAVCRLLDVDSNVLHRQISNINWLYKYLVLGNILGRIPKLQELIKKDITLAITTLIFAVAIYHPLNVVGSFDFTVGGYKETFIISLSAICIVYALAHRAQNDHWATKVLSYFGRNSLPIYLTHYFFIPSLVAYKYLLDLPTALGLSWEFALGGFGLVLTLVPTLLVMHGIQANPYLNLLVYGEPIKKKKIV